MATMEERLEKQLGITGVKRYHDQGFKGRGITILNHEAGTEHGAATSEILRKIAPEVTIIEASVTSVIKNNKLASFDWRINGEVYTFSQVMEEFKPDIINVSLRGEHSEIKEQVIKPYIDAGEVIVCNATGNFGADGVQGYYKSIALNIGSVGLNKGEVYLVPYSGRTKDKQEVSFVCFEEFLGGTSAACPYFAGMIALFLSRYKLKLSQEELVEMIKPYCLRLGLDGEEWKYGNGLFILPDASAEEIGKKVGELRGTAGRFTDIDGTEWYAGAVENCVLEGIVEGYPDGTFRPEKYVTRAELAAVIDRLIKRG